MTYKKIDNKMEACDEREWEICYDSTIYKNKVK